MARALKIVTYNLLYLNQSNQGSVYEEAFGFFILCLASSAQLCDLSPAAGANDAEFCKALYSSLLVAKASNNTVTLWFNIDSDSSCSKGSWVNLYKDHGLYQFRIGS